MTTSWPRAVIFCGKGGVGKSTCSAAIALHLATRGTPTLHLTSDLAPSLSDIYGVPVGDREARVSPGLDALEISMESVGRVWKERFGPDFREILARILDVEGMASASDVDLLDYIGTAPSLREETLLDLIVERASAGRHRLVIWDTAPAGETLRLLDMPRIMRDHLRAGARVYEAIDSLTGGVTGHRSLARIMGEWVERSDRIARFLREETGFVVVSNPEAVVVAQAERVLADLEGRGLRVLGLIANRVAEDPCDDPFLERMREAQAPHMRRLGELAGPLPLAALPFTTEEIRGPGALRTMGERLARGLRLE